MNTIAENITAIQADIARCEILYSRPTASVDLLAVSKRHSIDSIRLAATAGLCDFGENYLQEALDKIEQLKDLRLTWHFIGPVQSNKTKKIAENFSWVHSVDREKIALRLSEHSALRASPLNICIQINLSAEASKSGITLDTAHSLCARVDGLPHLSLRGLMAIPAATDSIDQQREMFKHLHDKFSALQDEFPSMDTLSMGMSNDFEAAIAEGSTMIRIGTALFGARPS